MLVLVLIGYALLVIYDFVPLYKQKLWRDFYVNAALGTLSFATAVLLSLGVEIPSPAVPIKGVVTTLFGK
jgi:hypothetical protein